MILEATCEAVEAIQERLTHSCRRLLLVWHHQILYGIILLVLVHSYVSETIVLDTEESVYNMLYYAWHGVIGSMIFIVSLAIPASVTGRYVHMPLELFMGLRARGITVLKMETIVIYLRMECVGYRV